MLFGLALAASIANLVVVIATKRHVPLIEFYVLEVIALAVVPCITYLNHYRARTSSSLILLFWPAYILALLIWARTVYLSNFTTFRVVLALRLAVAVFGLFAFVLECFGPEFTDEDHTEVYVKGHVESPLLTANIFSIWTFSWMSNLMKKGAKAYITEDDLPSLVPKDESVNLGDALRNAMKKQYVPRCCTP